MMQPPMPPPQGMPPGPPMGPQGGDIPGVPKDENGLTPLQALLASVPEEQRPQLIQYLMQMMQQQGGPSGGSSAQMMGQGQPPMPPGPSQNEY